MFALKEKMLQSYQSNHLPVWEPEANHLDLSDCPSVVLFSLTSQRPLGQLHVVQAT